MHRIYSFDLSAFEQGQFVATRYPDCCNVGGDWVCRAHSDEYAFKLAQHASLYKWCAPNSRHPQDFTVEFRDSFALAQTQRSTP